MKSESAQEWSARLNKLAMNCEFGTAFDTKLTDRFIIRYNPGKVRNRLFSEKKDIIHAQVLNTAIIEESAMAGIFECDVGFDFAIKYVNTSENIADVLSRLSLGEDETFQEKMFSSEEDLQEFGGSHVTSTYLSSCSTLPIDLAKMKHGTLLDPALKDISSYVRSGWPSNSRTDAFSKWLEVFQMNSITSNATIEKLRELFSRFGLPSMLVSDNGTQLISDEFQTFMRADGMNHITIFPYNPAPNGAAENSVKTVKQFLLKKISESQLKNVDLSLCKFLLNYRANP
ncbi:hypothetical protein JTB14_022656 [Gonioctena quinquepunctata]|nr:hypothetical protein JTB14_022656 [Gonioctena quinquepunctata]